MRKLRDVMGQQYTVKVEKVLSTEEVERLIERIRVDLNEPDATVNVVMPIKEFDFSYEILETTEEKPVKDIRINETTGEAQKIYSDNFVVMQNRLLNAITNLSINERRLIMFLSPLVRKSVEIDCNQRTFEVVALDFARKYKINKKTVYRTIESVADSLINKGFFFWDFKMDKTANKKGSAWVAECEYLEGMGTLEVTLTDTVTEMLTVFDKSHPFTKYELEYIVNLGSHGIILFELITTCMYQKHKQKSYTINYLREKFNCTDKYQKITDFKFYVLDKAIADIESETPLRIKYKQKKKGREITDIIFSFESIEDAKKLDNDNKTPKKHKSMTGKQISWFASKLANDASFGAEYAKVGEDMMAFEQRIKHELTDSSNQEKWFAHLRRFGYKQQIH